MKRLIILIVLAMTAIAARASGPIAFTRYIDRTEGAFLLLVPSGWQTAGGIVRVNPLAGGGSGAALGAVVGGLGGAAVGAATTPQAPAPAYSYAPRRRGYY